MNSLETYSYLIKELLSIYIHTCSQCHGILRLYSIHSLYSKVPVVADNILLRDAQLRNTDCVYGLVVYTGHDSKIMRNARSVPLKRSSMDHKTNRQVRNLVFFHVK